MFVEFDQTSQNHILSMRANRALLLSSVLAFVLFSSCAKADSPMNITGTWMIDGKATEEFVCTSPPPLGISEFGYWLFRLSGYLALTAIEFAEDTAIVRAYRADNPPVFTRRKGADNEFVHAMNAASSSHTTLKVVFIGEKHIRVAWSDSPNMAFLVWKRGKVSSNINSVDDMLTFSREFLAAVERLAGSRSCVSAPSMNTDAVR